MKMKNPIKWTNWLMTSVATTTMVMSPVAQGREAAKLSSQNLKQYVQEIGLNKKITAKEFWEKTKDLYPSFVYHEFEAAIKANPNAPMPQFNVKTVKSSTGEEVPVIQFTENGQDHTVQFFGASDKYLKFDNTFISESHAMNPEKMTEDLIAGDSKIAARYDAAVDQGAAKFRTEALSKSGTSSSAQIEKFPTVNKALWQTMSAKQRVSYIIYMRQMYLDAQNVLKNTRVPAATGTKSKKTSSMNIFELLFKDFVPTAQSEGAVIDLRQDPTDGGEATALNDDIKPKRKKKLVKAGDKVITSMGTGTVTSESCVVAGYVGKNIQDSKTKRKFCSIDQALADARYNGEGVLPDVVAASEKFCASGSVACNPVVYSYNSDGKPYCIQRSRTGVFQQATHWESKVGGQSCDQMSRLNLDAQGTGSADLTAAFLKNYLKASNKSVTNCIALDANSSVQKIDDKTWAANNCDSLFGEINSIAAQFKTDIDTATGICKAMDIKKQYDSKNQKEACEQIQKRKLMLSELFGKICPDNTKLDNVEAPTKCVADKKEEVGTCPEGSTNDEQPGTCICKTADGRDLGFKASMHAGLPKECSTTTTPVDENSCPSEVSKQVTLKNKTTLNADCKCVNKKGKVIGYPTEKKSFFGSILNTKKWQDYKNSDVVDFTHKTNASGEDARTYTCKNGPNWLAIGGIALGVGGIVALLLMKNKTKTNTIVKTNTVTNTIDNTFTCEPPKSPVVVGQNTDGTKQYQCVCTNTCTYFVNGVRSEFAPNPNTCVCGNPPSEGGSGENPTDGGGGIPTGKTNQ